MYTFNKVLPFIGKQNPTEDPTYHSEILDLFPTLRTEIIKILEQKTRSNPEQNHEWRVLSKNEGIVSKEDLELHKAKLFESFEKQYTMTGNKKPLVVVRDTCFTNDLLEGSLLRIFGQDLYEKYVDFVNIDYWAEDSFFVDSKNIDICCDNIHPNAIILLWGSLADTYTIPLSHYGGKLASIIRDNLMQIPPKGVNNRILGICFGQQFVANLLGSIHKESPAIIATIKGVAQFMPAECTMENMDNVPDMAKQAFDGITNFGTNFSFTSAFTRSGHVDFNLLDSKQKILVTPIARDVITGGCIGWSFRRAIWFGWHPEIRFKEDSPVLTDKMSMLAYALKKDYGDEILGIANNFALKKDTTPIQNIDEAFYVFALKAMSDDIVAHIWDREEKLSISPLISRSVPEESIYYQRLGSLLLTVYNKVTSILHGLEPDFMRLKVENKHDMLTRLDFSKKLILNSKYDWKVNRWNAETSALLGFKNLAQMTNDIVSHMNAKGDGGPYIFRDWGAGNGTLLKELHENLPDKNIIFYGVGDAIYFDLYQWLKKFHHLYPDIPEEVLVLLTQKVIEKYNVLEEGDAWRHYTWIEDGEKRGNLYAKVYHILEDVELLPTDTIFFASMFSRVTTMFPGENIKILSQETQAYILSHPEEISLLKKRIRNQFYTFFEGFFERIYIADFAKFCMSDQELLQADIQVAVRSTSHVDNSDYVKVLSEYIQSYSRDGSVLFENGVHRSYSSVPRIAELKFIANHHASEGVTIDLVYDTKTNYFSTAIIQKRSILPKDFFEKHLSEGSVLVTIQEASECVFFKFEAFFRNFLVSSFRDYDIFFEFNGEIVKFLRKSIYWLEDKKNSDLIFNNMTILVNSMVDFYRNWENNQQREYDYITLDSLLFFRDSNGESLYEIIYEESTHPQRENTWFNPDGKRRN